MSSIRDAPIALDTNQFVFGLRGHSSYPECAELLRWVGELKIFVPLQVLLELQRNLTELEMHAAIQVLNQAEGITWDYAPASPDSVREWETRGAKKGDAVIAAQLQRAGVEWLVSENRHFLSEVSDLPFQVLTSKQFLGLLHRTV